MSGVSLIIIGALAICFGLVLVNRALHGLSKGVYKPICFFPCFGGYRVRRSPHSGVKKPVTLLFCKGFCMKKEGKSHIREINSNFFALFIFWRILAGLVFIAAGGYLIYLGL